MKVRPLEPGDVDAYIVMRDALYDDCPLEQHQAEVAQMLATRSMPKRAVGKCSCFIAELDGAPVGFAEVMLRSHAEGAWDYTADGTVGIACLEGWYVDERARGEGVGRALVDACRLWARDEGSPVLCSDALLDNTVSHQAHQKLGFEEVERSVHFVLKTG